MSPRRCAFIDIGTNAILCLIVELRETGRFRVLEDLAEIPRLGEGVDRTKRVGAAGERRSVKVLESYLSQCRNLGVEEIIAVGTSALRDAQNSGEVLARLQARLGFEIRVLSGEEEAAYSFLSVQRGLSLAGRELLVIDVGGGSTEFIRGNDSGMAEALSVDLGAVRLTERLLRSDPVKPEEYEGMVALIVRGLAPLRDRWRNSGSSLTLVGIAGTFTTLAAVEKKLTRYSHSEVHGSRLTLAEVRRQARLFLDKTIAERKKIPGLEPKRADVILAGACLIERIMTLFHAREVIVSDQGVRYGLLYEQLDRLT
ncbi:MAG: Ppx/GppA family phosphatase [Deltaproteobacteria bacterium]|nr:Ppx/GppA family phosphatase [Deltaproteobacteria bacterium]MBI2230082.1 Ppx/GppA family phosphatase [Deltaproteobacteria bacterium]